MTEIILYVLIGWAASTVLLVGFVARVGYVRRSAQHIGIEPSDTFTPPHMALDAMAEAERITREAADHG